MSGVQFFTMEDALSSIFSLVALLMLLLAKLILIGSEVQILFSKVVQQHISWPKLHVVVLLGTLYLFGVDV